MTRTHSSTNRLPEYAPVVLYDGDCPLCRREIGHYRKRKGSNEIRWIDARTDSSGLNSLGVSQHDALEIFHVRDHQGNWHTGASAFLYLWSRIQPYDLLAGFIVKLHLGAVLDRAYGKFLIWRRWRECSTGDRCTRRNQSR